MKGAARLIEKKREARKVVTLVGKSRCGERGERGMREGEAEERGERKRGCSSTLLQTVDADETDEEERKKEREKECGSISVLNVKSNRKYKI